METVELIKIQEMINSLESKIEALNQPKVEPEEPFQSPEINDISAAFSKAQAELPRITKNRRHSFAETTFAELSTTLAAVRSVLSKFSLSLRQYTKDTDGAIMLYTVLTHDGGQFISSRIRIKPSKSDIRSYRCATDFYAKHQIELLLALRTEGDDDDGDYEMSEPIKKNEEGLTLTYNAPKKEESYDMINKTECEELEYELKECPDLAEQLLDTYNISRIRDLPKTAYREAIEKLRTIKERRKNINPKR